MQNLYTIMVNAQLYLVGNKCNIETGKGKREGKL